MEEMARVTSKFVALAEYVKEYDWEGEYHASEVESLLAIAKAIPLHMDELEVCSGPGLGRDSADRLAPRQRPTKPIEGKGKAIVSRRTGHEERKGRTRGPGREAQPTGARESSALRRGMNLSMFVTDYFSSMNK
jgi:hypothetical protein